MIGYISPIITSLLDTDAYKLHMQQAVFHYHYDVMVTAEFYCRSNDFLGIHAEEIRKAVKTMGNLSLTDEEFLYLSKLPVFRNDYLNWLYRFRFDYKQVQIEKDGSGNLSIVIQGLWREVILWEVPLLAIISEIAHQHRHPISGKKQAVQHLYHKLESFQEQTKSIDMSKFYLVDFGTRRRYSKSVQNGILTFLKQDFPWFIGTSNYDIARRLKLDAIGTQAHEWFQAFQQISPILADSQKDALKTWLMEYNDKLGIALTDCITMDAFLRDFDFKLANQYQGLRHDSGDPIKWGDSAIEHFRKLGIDPRTKTLVFSDGLTLGKSLELYRYFEGRINVVFGIGTNLTCDIPGITPINIVIKLVQCNGRPVAKISDSPGKTICQDKFFVKSLKKAFHLPLLHEDT
jgi:nicotinate phosphoribosyltransferase